MIIKQAKFSNIYHKLYPMLQNHWDELGEVESCGKFQLDVARLMMLENLNQYICFTADIDGETVGYMSVVITPGIHTMSDTYAITDATYVSPEYRNSLAGIGLKLLKHAEKVLKEDYNVTVFQFGVNKNNEGIRSFLEKMGFKESQINYNKRLGD